MFCLSPIGRRFAAIRAAAVVVYVLGAGCVLAATAQAQTASEIVSYVDSHGRVVYINANPSRTTRQASGHKPAAMAVPARLENVVQAAARKNNLDPALLNAVITAESNWNPYAVSRKGAMGLMQLEPKTAERFGVEDVFDPAQNINAGTRYLRELLDRYHGDLRKSLAAYNAGEQAVARYGGVPAYRETRNYVRKVTSTYFQSGSENPFRSSPIREATARDGRTVFTNE